MENLRLAEEPNGLDSLVSAGQGNFGSVFNCDNTQAKNSNSFILIWSPKILILHWKTKNHKQKQKIGYF